MKNLKIKTDFIKAVSITYFLMLGYCSNAQTVVFNSNKLENNTVESYLMDYDKNFRIVLFSDQVKGTVKAIIPSNPNHENIEITISRNGNVIYKKNTDTEKSFLFEIPENPKGNYQLTIKAMGKITDYDISTDATINRNMNLKMVIHEKENFSITKK